MKVSSQWEGMEVGWSSALCPGSSQHGVRWGCERFDASGGTEGRSPPCTRGVLGRIPDARSPLQPLPFAVLRAHYPGSGCTSSCLKINWQLNVIFLLALSREMKLFMVLHVAEFVREGHILEIIAADSNFLCHLSM